MLASLTDTELNSTRDAQVISDSFTQSVCDLNGISRGHLSCLIH